MLNLFRASRPKPALVLADEILQCLTMPNWEEEEDEENGKESQMLGFMFGNVDDAGDLDVEYLDQVRANVSLQLICAAHSAAPVGLFYAHDISSLI